MNHFACYADELLIDFFKFYATVDLSSQGLSVYEGTFVEKPFYEKKDADSNLENSKDVSDGGDGEVGQSAPCESATGVTGASGKSATVLEGSTSSGASLHLENPVERNLNAAKNVLLPNLIHFQQACHDAHQLLSSSPNSSSSSEAWGLLKILSVDESDGCGGQETSPMQQETTAAETSV